MGRRFDAAWHDLASIGARPDGGYDRFAWTDEDAQMRRWFATEAASRSLTVETDRNGNQWAWWGRRGPGAVVTGSHLDSVPGGGAYDGPLGVLSGFLAVDELRRRSVTPVRPIAVANFVDEEGARFGLACMGSRLLCGEVAPPAARALRDTGGTTLAEAMATNGADPAALGAEPDRLEEISAFVELHVEQGRDLIDRGAAVGVATAIWPHGRWRFRFSGEGNHAGTTRLDDRRDPMLPFASTVLAARQAARRAGAHTTFGRVEVTPNWANAIASQVDAWLDARAPTTTAVARVVDEVTAHARQVAAGHGVDVEITSQSSAPAVEFADELRERLGAVLATRRRGPVPHLPTGAGHDAGVLAAFVPAAMLFVRNPTGVSHSPAEHADRHDCLAGVAALSDVLADLACS
ncbi:MAG: allantoate amidohydrolase [Acidimicrobiales bacterium]